MRTEQKPEYAYCAHCSHAVQWHLGDAGCEYHGCSCTTFIHRSEPNPQTGQAT